jgi:zinc ribbon protein
MTCRHCGTEIADKAIICYRCGAATTDPVRRAAPIRPRRGRALSLVGLVLLVLLGLYLGQAGQTVLPAGRGYGLGAGLAIGVAIILLVVRISRRR